MLRLSWASVSSPPVCQEAVISCDIGRTAISCGFSEDGCCMKAAAVSHDSSRLRND